MADPYGMPCPECACDPDDAWGCDCSNEDCPCSEPEDDEPSADRGERYSTPAPPAAEGGAR